MATEAESTEAPDPEAVALEAAYAIGREMAGDDSEPEPAGEPDPVVEAADGGETDEEPAEPTSLGELQLVAAKRKAEREEREAADAPARELAELKAALAEIKAAQAVGVTREPTGIDPGLWRDDPMAALQAAGINPRDHLQALTRSLANPGVPQLEAKLDPKLAAMRAEIDELKAGAAKPTPEAQQEATQGAARDAFGAFLTAQAADYPALTRLPLEQRVAWGWKVAQESHLAGVHMDDTAIAAMLEKELAGEPATPAQGATGAASSGDTSGKPRNGRPNGITNTLAAPSTKGPPRTEEERLAAAKAMFANPDG